MCLLIYKPAGANVQPILDDLRAIAGTHEDGFGLAYFREGKVWSHRGFYTPQQMETSIKYTEDYPTIYHWRMATGGKRNESNCHPFKLRDGSVFAHNGVIPDIRLSPTNKKSDTHILADLSPTEDDFWANLGRFVVSGNKFALMNPKGQVYIWGEKLGTWSKDIWWSNFMHSSYGCYRQYSHGWAYDDCGYTTRKYKSLGGTIGGSDTQLILTESDGKKREEVPAIEALNQEWEAAMDGVDLDLAVDLLVKRFGYKAVCEAIELQPYFASEDEETRAEADAAADAQDDDFVLDDTELEGFPDIHALPDDALDPVG